MIKLNNAYLADDIYVQVGDFAKIIERTDRQITTYVDKGLPFTTLEGKKHRLFPVVKCIEWLIINGYRSLNMPINETATYDEMDSQEARRRQDVVKAQMMELELAKEKGELISVEDIRKENERTLVAFRNRALALPTATAASLVGLETVAEAKQILEDAMYQLLTELSRLDDTDV